MTGAASATAAATQITLHPNHLISAKGNPHGGGGGSCPSNSSLGWASSNWSGYAETCSAPYSAVTGNWTVPSVSGPDGSYSAAWVGIDGFNNSSLIQTGTEQDVGSTGAPAYAAWWTTSAQSFVEQPISAGETGCGGAGTCGAVNAGDAISATITQSATVSTSWTITISDTTAGWTFATTVTYTGPGASAEWIVEAPTVGGKIATLANYGTDKIFDDGLINATAAPNLTYGEGGEMVTGRGPFARVISIPSSPDTDSSHDGFAISYGKTAPSPPSS